MGAKCSSVANSDGVSGHSTWKPRHGCICGCTACIAAAEGRFASANDSEALFAVGIAALRGSDRDKSSDKEGGLGAENAGGTNGVKRGGESLRSGSSLSVGLWI